MRSRPSHDDEADFAKKRFRIVPERERVEAVGSDEPGNFVPAVFAELAGGIDRIAGAGSMEFAVVDLKAGNSGNGQPAHLQAMLRGSKLRVRRLMRRSTGRKDDDGSGPHGLRGGTRAKQVPVMDWVKRTSQTNLFLHRIEPEWMIFGRMRITELPKVDQRTGSTALVDLSVHLSLIGIFDERNIRYLRQPH
jgi:hypothetical protein